MLINYIFCTECVLYTHWKKMLLSFFPPVPKTSRHRPHSCPLQPYIVCTEVALAWDWQALYSGLIRSPFPSLSLLLELQSVVLPSENPCEHHLPSSASALPPLITFSFKWDHASGYELALDWGLSSSHRCVNVAWYLDTHGPNCGWQMGQPLFSLTCSNYHQKFRCL